MFTAELLKQGYRYNELRKAFSKFYRRYYELIQISFTLRPIGPRIYDDLVYKFKKEMGKTNFLLVSLEK